MIQYKTPDALLQAAKAAAHNSPRETGKALESFFIDRFLCRVFSESTPAFVLKGGQSQLARRVDARESRDADLVGTETDIELSLQKLRELASIDLGDYLEYQFDSARRITVSQEYREGYRVVFLPVLGGVKKLNKIGIDLVVDQTPPESFEWRTPASRLDLKGLTVYDYALQTIEERIADKVCATMQLFEGLPSSRVKDLVDLVVSMRTDHVNADVLAEKLKREAILRKMKPIYRFAVPDEWKTMRTKTYQNEALACGLPTSLCDASEAERSIAQWLAPVLDGTAIHAAWFPDGQEWG